MHHESRSPVHGELPFQQGAVTCHTRYKLRRGEWDDTGVAGSWSRNQAKADREQDAHRGDARCHAGQSPSTFACHDQSIWLALAPESSLRAGDEPNRTPAYRLLIRAGTDGELQPD